MTKERDFENVQWIYDYLSNSYLNIAEEVNTDLNYYHYLTPFSNSYYGLSNPIILFGGHRKEDLSAKKIWTIRDGMIPLAIFFRELAADTFKGELYVPVQFWYLVPNEWRPKVKYYEVKSNTVYSKKNLPKKILITGFMNSTMADAEDFKSDLEQVQEILGKENLKNIEIVAYFPGKRNDLWGGWREENVLKYSRYLFENLKMDIQFPDLHTITSENNYADCAYIEINRHYIIQETYMKHIALSRGAGELESPATTYPMNKIASPKLSLYHHMNVYELDTKLAEDYMDPLSDKSFESLKKVLISSARAEKMTQWWEAWFATYIKKYYKAKEGKIKIEK